MVDNSDLHLLFIAKKIRTMTDPASKLQMLLTDSQFLFSKRMLNFFRDAELKTVADLAQIPLCRLTCFRGFKEKRRHELLRYIEFEHIEELFDGFSAWKSLDAIYD